MKRNSNLELLRIICMICIIFIHIFTQTSLYNVKIGDGVNYYFALLLCMAGRLVINCFVMIGAWFLTDKAFKAERVINLWLEIFFYCGGITLICIIKRVEGVSIINGIQAFFPVFGRPVWFGAEYICLLLLTPFLNSLLTLKDTTLKLLKIFSILMIGCSTVFPIEHTMPAFSELVWFCYLYLLVGYFKKYRSEFHIKKRFCLLAVILGYGFICLLKVVADVTGIAFIKSVWRFYMVHYEAFPGFVASVGLFLLFKDICINSDLVNRIIQFIAKPVFAVYLIHQTPAFYPFLWNGIFSFDEKIASGSIVCYAFGAVLLIWIAAGIFDFIRNIIFEHIVYKSGIYRKVKKIIMNMSVQ